MSFLPVSILPDFPSIVDGQSPVIVHYQPPPPPGEIRHPRMRFVYCEHALRRERTIVSEEAVPQDVVVFHLWNPDLGGIEPSGGEAVIDNQGYVYVIQTGSLQTFASRLRYTCKKPSAGTLRYRPWNTLQQFLDGLQSPLQSDGQWTGPSDS